MSRKILTPTEKLDLLFQKKLGKRELIWLRMMLENFGLAPSDHNPESFDAHKEMAEFISKKWWGGGERNVPFASWRTPENWQQDRIRARSLQVFWREVGTHLDQDLLNEDAFSWIKETGRQPTWLLIQLDNPPYFRTGDLLNPHKTLNSLSVTDLSDKEKFVAQFDYWSTSSENKLRTLDQLQQDWNRQLIEEKPFSWYKKDPRQEKKKCECAWNWYSNNKSPQRRRANPPPKFNNLDEVLAYIDDVGYSLEESLYHLEQIKKKFKSQQVAANRKGKKQTNLSLSEETREMLELLSNQNKMTRTELVEYLIQEAYENGI